MASLGAECGKCKSKPAIAPRRRLANLGRPNFKDGQHPHVDVDLGAVECDLRWRLSPRSHHTNSKHRFRERVPSIHHFWNVEPPARHADG